MIGQEKRVALLCRVRSALPAAVSLLCLGILLSSCSSGNECTYDTDCPGNQTCIDGKCVIHYPQHCPDRDCSGGFVCIDDMCVELTCLGVNCPEGEVCAGGECYPKDCESRTCPGIGEVCIEEDCLTADCLDVECPQGQRCAVGHCYPIDCETKNCPGYGEVCIDEECVQRTCVGVSCPEGQRCANGYCYPENCTEVGCFGEGEVCVDGVCQRISCLGVDCLEGYRCANGWCYPADCFEEDCSDFGEVCYEGKCVPADCAGVVCPPEQRCAHGECFPEECEDLTCEADEVCYDGQCVNWNCVGINCPAEHNCVDGECVQVHCPEPCTMDNQCDTADCGGVEMTCLFDEGLGSPAWGAQGRTCSDGDACTVDDACDQGVCGGTGLVCDEPPADICEGDVAVTYPSVGECQGGECLYPESRETCPGGCVDGHCEGNPCDGIVCDSHEHCESGNCVCDDGWADCQGATPGCETELWTLENCTGCGDACEDGNPCTTDVCDPAEGCKYTNNILPCDDGEPCSHDDTCSGGTCSGTPITCDDDPTFCGADRSCNGTSSCTVTYPPAGTSSGLCAECDGSGGERVADDDSACGTIDCDGLNYYYLDGDHSPSGTDYCKYRNYRDITSHRCEGIGNCKDANSSDCTSYTTTTKVTCGTCKAVRQCDSVDQTCGYYDTTFSCGYCSQCNGAGLCCNCAWVNQGTESHCFSSYSDEQLCNMENDGLMVWTATTSSGGCGNWPHVGHPCIIGAPIDVPKARCDCSCQ